MINVDAPSHFAARLLEKLTSITKIKQRKQHPAGIYTIYYYSIRSVETVVELFGRFMDIPFVAERYESKYGL